jgi:predicted nucleic acid-binding protein
VNVLDTSGWLAFFTGESNASYFRPIIESPELLVVPTITVFEVYRHFLRERGRADALIAVGAMQQGNVVELTSELATIAAALAHEHKLAMADSIILATAQQFEATLWTQDVDFEGLEKVNFRPKTK